MSEYAPSGEFGDESIMAERKTSQKVCLFIDNNSLARLLGERKVNFKLLKNWLAGDREAVVALFYCGETNKVPKESREKLYTSLERAGFEVRVAKNPFSRSISPESDAEIDSAIACQMTWDMAQAINNGYYNSLILLSGAYEMSDVVRKIRKKGVEVEVVYDEEECSPTLKGAANRFRQLVFDKISFVAKAIQRRDEVFV